MNQETGTDWVADRLRRWAADQSPEALGDLLKWQRNRAFAIAYGILSREHDAEDAVQEAFAKLLTDVPRFGSPSEFCGIVNRAVSQRAIDLARKAYRRHEREKPMSRETRSGAAAPPAEAERAEALAALREELLAMEPEDRALLVLCCQESQNVSGAAASLDLPRETVRDRLRQLMESLRSRLARRGHALALLPIVAWFQEGSAAEAGQALCRALDAQLPGLPCQGIPAAGPAAVPASVILGQAGLAAASAWAVKLAAVGATVAVAGLSAVVWHAAAKPAPAPGRPAPIASAPAIPEPGGALVAGPASTPTIGPKAEPKVAPRPATASKRKQEVRVPLAELPAAVKAAAEAAVPGLVITEADREERKGAQLYSLEGRVGDKRYDLDVTPEGRVLKIEEDQPDDDQNNDEQHDDDAGKKPAAAPAAQPAPAVEVF